jgi:hypothetical protein
MHPRWILWKLLRRPVVCDAAKALWCGKFV